MVAATRRRLRNGARRGVAGQPRRCVHAEAVLQNDRCDGNELRRARGQPLATRAQSERYFLDRGWTILGLPLARGRLPKHTCARRADAALGARDETAAYVQPTQAFVPERRTRRATRSGDANRAAPSPMRALHVLSAVAVAHAFAPTPGGARRATIRHGLLKGLDPLLSADLLYTLRRAGHGDVIAVVDCNFPAVEVASKTTTGTLVEVACNVPALKSKTRRGGFAAASRLRRDSSSRGGVAATRLSAASSPRLAFPRLCRGVVDSPSRGGGAASPQLFCRLAFPRRRRGVASTRLLVFPRDDAS